MTPLAPGMCLSKSDSLVTAHDIKGMHRVPYIQAMGTLLYLAMCTHLDISHAVSILCCFNSCPRLKHWLAVKHLLQYVKDTLDYRI